MGAKRYVALVRGINVGGRNRVAMSDLRDAFGAAGCRAVRTYIQSGNVLFEAEAPRDSLEAHLETMLERRLGIALVVLLRSDRQLRNVVSRAPDDFGTEPDRYHSDVIFLKAPLTSRRAMGIIDLREGVDQAWPGPGVIYFARLSDRLAQSRMSRIVGTSDYQQMTIRSWTTATKLLSMLDADTGA